MNEKPQLPEPSDRYHDLLHKYWLDYSRDYPEPQYMLAYNGVEFSPRGGLQAITGHQKNGKTFVMAMFMSVILNPQSERVRSYLFGLTRVESTIEKLGHEPKVLYIDTEMEDLNTVKVARRVQWLCGWPMNELNERFRVLWLRAVDDDEDMKTERWKLTQQAIMEFQPDFVVLDGIVDIVHDFNSNEESGRIIGEIMNIATKRDICIWTALHQNPGQDALGKMRGHLGTELANKSSDTFVSIKKKEGKDVTFTVKQINARNKDVEDFMYRVTDDAGKLGVPRIMDDNNIGFEQDSEKQKVADLFEGFEWSPTGTSITAIQKFLKPKGYSSYSSVYKVVQKAIDYELIQKGLNKKYYKGSAQDSNSQDLPFGKVDPNEKPAF